MIDIFSNNVLHHSNLSAPKYPHTPLSPILMSGILFFGYGAMVNPVSRSQRQIETVMEKPAVLDDHRLTFAVAGAANIVRKPGWSVHGIVMECKTEFDWERLMNFDAAYDYIEVDVLPYGSEQTIKARALVMVVEEPGNAKLPINRLPQERYIQIIAEGMKFHGIDQEVVDFHIMNVPYIPRRKPSEYLRFHTEHHPNKKRSKTKTISYDDFIMKSEKMVWIAIGTHVIQIKEVEEGNEGSRGLFLEWVKRNLVGKYDCTHFLVQGHYDPALASYESGITDEHREWAQNLLVEKFSQGGLTGTLVYLLKDANLKRRSQRLSSLLAIKNPMSFFRKGSDNNIEEFLSDGTESGESRTTIAQSSMVSSNCGDDSRNGM